MTGVQTCALPIFVLFVAYSTFRAFQNAYYFAEPYISPFYSPCITTACEGDTFPKLFTGPSWISPAIWILVFPLGFRLTCYYYRKAYYRSFWLSPPACAVAEPHRRYTGEARLPLLGQNLHRYFWYAALVFNVILTYDAVLAFRDPDGAWGHMGLGTLVLLANAALLWLYSLSCHSCRHIVGGRLNSFSRHPLRYRYWTAVSALNAQSQAIAMVSDNLSNAGTVGYKTTSALFEDLVTTVLIRHRGRLVRHGRLADLRAEAAAEGREESLEDLFFRLTEAPGPAVPAREA